MKNLLVLLISVLLVGFTVAGDRYLVKVPAPDNPSSLEKADFELYHRAGDYWFGSLPAGSAMLTEVISICQIDPEKGDLFRLIAKSPSEFDKLNGLVTIHYRENREAIIQAAYEQLQNLPPLEVQWIYLSLKPKPMSYSGVEVPQTDQFHPLVSEIVNQVSEIEYTQFIQSLQDFITRNTFTAGCDNSAQWIRGQLDSYGLDTELDPFIISGNTKYNVVGELVGEVYPDSIVFVTGHYDATAGSPSSPEPQAPGADDNASGVACVLESARILSQYSFERTIRFVAFAGEEQGLYGSEDYVNNLVSANTDVVGCINYDMIGYSGNDPLPPDLMLYANNNQRSQAIAYKIAEGAMTFTPGDIEPIVVIDPSVVYSDHSPFWDAGYPAALGIEAPAWGSEFNPYYHSVNDLLIHCDTEYAANCARAAIAALAQYAGPIVESGPALTICETDFSEFSGNGNGVPDPGETFDIAVTMINLGVDPATGITATLTTDDPYLTITQNYATFPNLNPGETGAGSAAYRVEISVSCPLASWVVSDLEISANGGYTNTAPLNFQVGNPIYQPTGPDAYGYYAYDDLDIGGQEFDWIEIDPNQGGPGSEINYTGDDQTVQVDLPFNFTYYGADYDEISVCSNGWIAMGYTIEVDWSNSEIPDSDGPPAMIAPFWEDLSPQIIGSVSHYNDAAEHRFIVEFNGVRQYLPTSALETFEVVLYDPAYYTTPTGDGKILFQFGRLSDPSSCTVGIEDPTETIGLQYLYNSNHDYNAAPVDSGRTILFTTSGEMPEVTVDLTPYGTPIQIPAGGGNFEYNIAGANNESISQTFNIWCEVTLPNGSPYGPVLGPVEITLGPGISLDRDRVQAVPSNAPAGTYHYNAYAGIYPGVVWSEDSFEFEKLADGSSGLVNNWNNWGEDFGNSPNTAEIPIPKQYSFNGAYPNPFNPTANLVFEIPEAGNVYLIIYDIQGREASRLVEGWLEAGFHSRTFDGSDLSSGIYFARMQAENYSKTVKLILMK